MDSVGNTEAARTPGLLGRLLPRYAANPWLLAYVFGVFGVGTLLLFVFGGPPARLWSASFAAWMVFSVLAEFLWLETIYGDCTDSMS